MAVLPVGATIPITDEAATRRYRPALTLLALVIGGLLHLSENTAHWTF